jgi:hypothetical protein
MTRLTLKLQRRSKNGIVSYKADNQRSTGIVYFTDKMFPGDGAPETLVIEADGIQVPAPKEPRAPKAGAPQADVPPADAPELAGEEVAAE